MPSWCGHGRLYLFVFAFKCLTDYSFITLRCLGETSCDGTLNYANFGVLLTSRIISLPELHLYDVKGKVHPIQATKGLEGEYRYSSTHSQPRR
jgi:hypothetical protein